MVMFARICPVDKRKGHKVKRYNFRGFTFDVERGWYRVADSVAEQLKKCVVDPNAPIPVSVFQVATESEAKALERRTYEQENPERKIEQAVTGATVVSERKLQPPPKTVEEEAEEVEEIGEMNGDDEGTTDDNDAEPTFG